MKVIITLAARRWSARGHATAHKRLPFITTHAPMLIFKQPFIYRALGFCKAWATIMVLSSDYDDVNGHHDVRSKTVVSP